MNIQICLDNENKIFKFDSIIKVKYSSLAWIRTKPINNVWEISLKSPKVWVWFDLLVKLSSNSMTSTNLSSLSCFWAWDLINIHYQAWLDISLIVKFMLGSLPNL